MEANNTKAMRDVVAGIKNTAHSALTALSLGNYPSSFLWDIIRKCAAALAAPPRNCDVGTTQEQEARFEAFCHAHRSRERCCEDCPIVADRASCELAWAQMPYEKGGAR